MQGDWAVCARPGHELFMSWVVRRCRVHGKLIAVFMRLLDFHFRADPKFSPRESYIYEIFYTPLSVVFLPCYYMD